jgi:RNA polymerase sigma-70 factor (ECF subfamily)
VCDRLTDVDVDPEVWRSHHSYLMGVAYRLLGTVSEAEDAVQEAYLRLRRHEGPEIAEPRAWLTTVVSRICLDQLRSARARRESYHGVWLPEPLVGPDLQPGPHERAALRESVQTAMLVVLESLTPAERIAFVLHDVFDVGFEDIGEILGRSAPACRQLASRARSRVRDRVRDRVPRFDVSAAEGESVVGAVQGGARDGHHQGVAQKLDPTVVFRSDGGGVVPAARDAVHGADAVARLVHGLAQRYSAATVRISPVNGGPGLVMEQAGAVLAVASIAVAGGAVTAIDVVVNPAKLRHVGAATAGVRDR